jgi:hypothetical protein
MAPRAAMHHPLQGLRLQPGLAEFVQGLPCKQTGQEQPIGNKGVVQLDEGARHIIDEMEIENIKYGIKACGFEG